MDKERLASIDQEFANEQTSKARTELKQAIADTRAVVGSARLASIMNIRDKHLAHSLATTRREKLENSQKIDQHNAEALWTGCKFVDLR
jgi:hypothetical protein